MSPAHYLSDIEGISIYPIISLIIFFVFFIGLFYWVYKMSKNSAESYKQIPLKENQLTHPSSKNQ